MAIHRDMSLIMRVVSISRVHHVKIRMLDRQGAARESGPGRSRYGHHGIQYHCTSCFAAVLCCLAGRATVHMVVE
ncbi:hypothetical protein KC19_3G258700 [Ceratodon purpureus]|uniref:Uncharacterized protein n=1 Tax=Ceratodon purpureus TaxID=3225 RepID=A0A8T0IQJ6_CERPU|nr:hypothetical protein KC19_3G258700 [Ceratodon purpureus]